MRSIVVAVVSAWMCSMGFAQAVSPLFARGYTVVPQPQVVSLEAGDFSFGDHWRLKLDRSVAPDDVAVETLKEDLASRFNIALAASGTSGNVISLRVAPGSVPIGDALDPAKRSLEDQAYRLDLHKDTITITANAPTGLFYGVETLIQLVRRDANSYSLPEGSIQDWPDLQLRLMYWDDAHHLDRIDELKHDLRQAAFYKVDGFLLKLDGHFQFKSAPAVVEPDALTPSELQDLTNYGLRYHVQLIPYLDGPGHIAFVLKHPEYADLRAYPDNNFEMCVANPKIYSLLEGMYQELMDANKGVHYFYLSMDEPYYLGLAHNAQCDEAAMAKQEGSTGQLFVDFINKTGGYMHDHDRSAFFWGAFPLRPNNALSLAPYLIGNVYGPEVDGLNRALHQRGLRQIISTKYINAGDSRLFPEYFLLPPTQHLHEDRQGVPNLVSDILSGVSFNTSRNNGNIMGQVTSGWGDKGINPETFWLGYIAGSSAGWHPGPPNAQELESEFYSLFYGTRVTSMAQVYQLMSEQDQSWGDSWDTVPSTSRKPIWGGAYGKIYSPKKPAEDQALPLPPSPSADLHYESTWSADNAKRISLAAQASEQNDLLTGLLDENIQRSEFNRYNLEVYLSIAGLYRHGFTMIGDIHRMDVSLASASKLEANDPKAALDQVDNALDIAAGVWQERNEGLQRAVTTWDKDWFPRVEEANGRHFLHELDDVKDHMGDRTGDMSYLVYREKILPFGGWVNSILAARNEFAAAHNLPARKYPFDWDDFHTGADGHSSVAITCVLCE
jgi:hexosaminidase